MSKKRGPAVDVGDKVTAVHIRLNRDGTTKEQRIQELKVLDANADYAILNNYHFETISRHKTREKVKVYRQMDDVSIGFERDRKAMERLFGYCSITCYSTQPINKIQTLIRKALKKRLETELAFFGAFDVKTINLKVGEIKP